MLLYLAGQHIGEGDDALIINAKAQGWAAIIGLVFSALLLRQVAARSRVAWAFVFLWGAGGASAVG